MLENIYFVISIIIIKRKPNQHEIIMTDIIHVLNVFLEELKEDIQDYYERFYSYIRDLFADKSIDLKFKTSYESDKAIKGTVETMLKTIKVGLSTIGVSRRKFDLQAKINDSFEDYNSYFLTYKPIIDNILFEILIEYIAAMDSSKIENLDLFDLLPRKFSEQMDQFKESYNSSTHIKRAINKELTNLEAFINPSELTAQVEIRTIPVKPSVELKKKNLLLKYLKNP